MASNPSPKTVTYKTVVQCEIKCDLYLPKDAKNIPILIWFHGGGLIQGLRSPIYPHMLRGVNKYNYALLSADYRLAPQVGVKEVTDDVLDLLNFVRAGKLDTGDGVLDTSRICVSGSSGGGYLAFLAGLYAEPKPKVILTLYPITDPHGKFFTNRQTSPFGQVDRSVVAEYLDKSAQAVSSNERDSKRESMYFYVMQEAILADLLHVQKGDNTYSVPKVIEKRGLPPTYVVHGAADLLVGVEQADEAVEAMKKAGVQYEYERLSGVHHVFDQAEDVELEKMYEFMMKYI